MGVPFNRHPSIRRAAAMAINTALFTSGSPYDSTTAYPAYNPSEAKKLVKQVVKSTGKPVSLTWGSTNSSYAEREQ